MKLLLTGFEPFDKSNINPSDQVVRAIAHEKMEGLELCPAILPVDRVRGPQMLIDAFKLTRPDAVLCLGEASRRMALSVERVAVNLLDFRIADNAGEKVMDEPIMPGAPAAYFATLPVRAMYESIRAAGVPCELSLSAGTFLCNQVMYTILHYVAQNRLTTPAGFIHLPRLPEQVAPTDALGPSMGLETMIVGIRAAIVTVRQMLGEFVPRIAEQK
ncbi:MAG: pyroglutamyl-peptidase I [Chloroflexi bacterium]|nr:pyroglutamyl-peptidase I [Chloroflexota bacterium]